jgi:hypothetical protein
VGYGKERGTTGGKRMKPENIKETVNMIFSHGIMTDTSIPIIMTLFKEDNDDCEAFLMELEAELKEKKNPPFLHDIHYVFESEYPILKKLEYVIRRIAVQSSYELGGDMKNTKERDAAMKKCRDVAKALVMRLINKIEGETK